MLHQEKCQCCDQVNDYYDPSLKVDKEKVKQLEEEICNLFLKEGQGTIKTWLWQHDAENMKLPPMKMAAGV